MNTEKIAELLMPWLQVDTWHTCHRYDDQRYHLALKNVFSTLGTQLDCGDFSKAITSVVDDLYPDYEKNYRDELIEGFAIRSEHIAEYLRDTK